MSQQRIKKASGRIVPSMMLLFLLVAALLAYLSLMNQIHTKLSSTSSPYGDSPADSPAASASDSSDIQQLQDRIHYLETKVDSYLAYAKDPFLSTKTTATCQHQILIKDIACPDNKKCALDDQAICMDDFPYVIGGDNDAADEEKEKLRRIRFWHTRISRIRIGLYTTMRRRGL